MYFFSYCAVITQTKVINTFLFTWLAVNDTLVQTGFEKKWWTGWMCINCKKYLRVLVMTTAVFKIEFYILIIRENVKKL